MKFLFPCRWAMLVVLALSGVLVACSKSSAPPTPQPGDFEKPLQSLVAAQPAASKFIEPALVAFQAKDYVSTVTLLESVNRNPQLQLQLSPEQRLVIQGAINTVTLQLQAQALKGDAKAREDMHAIDRVLSR